MNARQVSLKLTCIMQTYKTYKMSRSTAVSMVFLIILGLTILMTAACCNSLQQQATVDNPMYMGDSVEYNSIDCYINGNTTNIVYMLSITYNEKSIVINNYEENFTVKFIGHWSNNNTFVIENNVGIATVNLKTKVLTIRYSDFTKEIYK